MPDTIQEDIDKVKKLAIDEIETIKKLAAGKLHILYLIIVFILILSIGFTYHKYDTKVKELDSLKGIINIEKSIQEEEAKLADLKKREEELYPLLERMYKEKSNLDSQIIKLRGQIKLIPKKEIQDEINKMDDKSLSDFFNAMGYSNTITR